MEIELCLCEKEPVVPTQRVEPNVINLPPSGLPVFLGNNAISSALYWFWLQEVIVRLVMVTWIFLLVGLYLDPISATIVTLFTYPSNPLLKTTNIN